MPPSAASALRVSSLALLLLAATAMEGDVSGNSSIARPRDDQETYICYLCDGRNPMLIRYCPTYWDWCHLICYDPAEPAAASLRPAAAATAARVVNDQVCYVMKLYRNGTYVIVSYQDCSRMASCILSCGGGDGADSKALGVAAANAGPVTATAPQGMLSPSWRVAYFQRCGDQAMAALPMSAVPGRV